MASELVRLGVEKKIKKEIYDMMLTHILDALVRVIEQKAKPEVIGNIDALIREGKHYCSEPIAKGDPVEAERCVDNFIAERREAIADKIVAPLMPILRELKDRIEIR